VDDGQGRVGKGRELGKHVRDLARILQVFFFGIVGHATHPIQIGAGRKAFSPPDDLHYTDSVVAGQFIQGFSETTDKHIVKCIVHFRAVENQRSDAALVYFGQYWSRVHVTS